MSIPYKILLFDLDGTLSDPKIGITKSVRYALEKLAIHEPNLEKLTPYIGPPLKNSFIKFHKLDEEKAWKAVQYFREYFSQKGIFENILYGGILDLIKELIESGFILYVASSKPEKFSKQIINFFKLNGYFEGIFGPSLSDKEASKVDIIKKILYRNYLREKTEFVMIGDREEDIVAAKKNNIDSIGILYGYGSKKEIEESKPTHTANSIKELKKLLLQK